MDRICPTSMRHSGMKRKQQFLRAIKILAPNDPFIRRAAHRVSQKTLPLLPGGAALEFVVALERFRSSIAFAVTAALPKPNHSRCRLKSRGQTTASDAKTLRARLRLKDALRVKSADYWLKLGQPDQALAELAALPKSVQRFPWPLKVHLAAVHAAGEGYITRTE
jgi:hypothetical protein